MQATTARTCVNTLQATVGGSQCSDHGHLSHWVHFAELELSWSRTGNEFRSQKRKPCTCLGTGTLGPPAMAANNRTSLFPTCTNVQFPTDSHALFGQLCIAADPMSSVQECVKVLLGAFESAAVSAAILTCTNWLCQMCLMQRLSFHMKFKIPQSASNCQCMGTRMHGWTCWHGTHLLGNRSCQNQGETKCLWAICLSVCSSITSGVQVVQHFWCTFLHFVCAL